MLITGRNDMQIHDNYLNPDDFNALEELMGPHFPWYAYNGVVTPMDGQPALTHTFYTTGLTQQYFNLIVPIMEKINPLALIRVKGNCVPRTTEHQHQGMHIDIEGTFVQRLTGILYLNTCNGYTNFENAPPVESVANRFVIFDGSHRHESVTQTDTPFRYVINFNWIGRY